MRSVLQEVQVTIGRAILFGLFIASTICPAGLRADPSDVHQLDEMLPGFKPKLVYDSSGIENLNVFSGDPNLSVPLGPSYPLSAETSFQLAAHYSAKFWRVSSAVCYNDTSECFNAIYVTRAHVTGYSTIGLGWTLELGFVAPYVNPEGLVLWRTSDGGSHECNVGGSCPDLNVRVLKANSNEYRVTYPDGTTHIYGHRYVRPPPPNGWDFTDENTFEESLGTYRYGLTQIIDPYGFAVLDVHYKDETNPESDPDRWKIDRIVLRRGAQGDCSSCPQITYHWRKDPSTIWDVLDYIQFPPSAATGGQGQVVRFSFADSSPMLRRSSADSGLMPQCAGYLAPPALTPVPLLTGILASDVSRYGFSYVPPDTENNIAGGAIQSVTLPTGGTITYAYEAASGRRHCAYPDGTCDSPEVFPVGGELPAEMIVSAIYDPCDDGALRSQFLDTSPAVTERTEFDPISGQSTTVGYKRKTYASKDTQSELYPNSHRVIRRVLVGRPSGNSASGRTYTAHYFTAAPHSGSQTVELERRIWHEPVGSPAPNRSYVNCYAAAIPEVPETCGVLQSVRGTGRVAVVDQFLMENTRRTREVTWYGANPLFGGDCSLSASVACHQTTYSGEWNSTARQYPVATESIDRNGPSIFLVQEDWVRRTTATTFSPITNATTWRPDLVGERLVSEDYTTGCTGDRSYRGPCSRLSRYEYEPANGFLKRILTVDPTDASRYIQTRYQADTSWNPGSEEKSGTGIVSPTVFSTSRLFQNGLVTKASVPGGWASFDVDRDPVTGLVTMSRDPNGLSTTFSYDVLGRLAAVTPPGGEVPARYGYFDWNPATPSTAPLVVAKANGSDPAQMDDGEPTDGSGTVEAYQFDGFGRLLRQIRRLPNANPVTGSYYAFLQSQYDAAGHLAFRSEWNPCGASPLPTDLSACLASVAAEGTYWSDFDFLGRPRSITAPDGSVTTKSFDDPGNIPDSDTTEITTVRLTATSSVQSATRSDIFGRILLVAEPADSALVFPYVSSFDYDIFGHLTRASILPVNGFAATKRTFTYSGLGLLEREFNPEHVDDASPGSGTTLYTSYDALGNVLAKSLNELEYAYAHDERGRLTSVSAGGTTFLRNYYDQITGSPSHSNNGRLTTRVGYNPGSTSVTETLDYSAATGRPASKTTSFSSGLLASVTERWHYNTLGLLATHNHPRQSGLFSVSTTYRSGLPVAVAGNGIPVVTEATYHPAGIVASYTTGNGSGHPVTTSVGIDTTTWMARPTSITTSGASLNLTESPFAYDALGNIRAIGSDNFLYDSRSRLTSATYGGVTREYSYDGFGNMTKNGPLTYVIDTLTNRVRSDSAPHSYAYDSRGNLQTTGSEVFTWDALDRMKTYQSGTSSWSYAYSAGNERILKTPSVGSSWGQYTLRDHANRVATEFAGNGTAAVPSRDDVYFGNLLVGSLHSCAAPGGSGWEYTASDHLGTPRLATAPNGTTLWQKKYWPFGETAVSSGQTSLQPLSYALMESDPKLSAADLERFYDHARSHSSDFGRFLSPDLLGGRPEDPQSFNRYAYARNNPLKYFDPDGNEPDLAIEALQGERDAGRMSFAQYNARMARQTEAMAAAAPYVLTAGAMTLGGSGAFGAAGRFLGVYLPRTLGAATLSLEATLAGALGGGSAVPRINMSAVGALESGVARNLKTLDNLVRDHGKVRDVVGTMLEARTGVQWGGQHVTEARDTIRGLNRVMKNLGGALQNPNLNEASQRAIAAAMSSAKQLRNHLLMALGSQ